MRSRPQFEVDVVHGDTTLGFTCSFLNEPPTTEEYSKLHNTSNYLENSWFTKVILLKNL